MSSFVASNMTEQQLVEPLLTSRQEERESSSSSSAAFLAPNHNDNNNNNNINNNHQFAHDDADYIEFPSDDNNEADDDDVPTFWGLFFYRSLFFLNGLSASAWGRFGVIYYNQICHLSPSQIGILQGMTPLVAFVATPLWGMLADRIQSRKYVYVVCQFMGTLCLLSLDGVPKTFLIVWTCVGTMSLFSSSGVLDAFCLDYLGPTHRAQYYGSVRLWTAISWGLGAVIMGYLTDFYGFQVNFILFGSMMYGLLIIVLFALPARSKTEQARYDQVRLDSTQQPKLQVLWKALSRLPVLLWLVQVILIGTGMALVDSFLFVYLQNDLQASTRLCGLTVGITVLFELPIFHYSQYLLRHVGHDGLFCISMVAYITRAYGYTILTESTVNWVLALEVLHGITFGCMWIASIDYSAAVAPTEWSTTVQSILSATFGCFGAVVGSIVGGWVMEKYSAVLLYRGMGCIMTAVLITHVVLWCTCYGGHDAFLESLKTQVADDDIVSCSSSSGRCSRSSGSHDDRIDQHSATVLMPQDDAGGMCCINETASGSASKTYTENNPATSC